MTVVKVKFWLNGRSLGVAFTDVRTFEPHLAYFPALSLSEGEASYVNLGAQPLRYPQAGFQPFMAPPAPGRVQACDWLLSKLKQLCVVRLPLTLCMPRSRVRGVVIFYSSQQGLAGANLRAVGVPLTCVARRRVCVCVWQPMS